MLVAKPVRHKETYQSLGRWFFWTSIFLSEIAGIAFGRRQAGRIFSSSAFFHSHPFLSPLLFQMLTAVMAFLILYGLLSLTIAGLIEDWTGVKIEKPGMARGILFTALVPLLLCGIGFLIILFLSGSPRFV
jgi:hypothetical protein